MQWNRLVPVITQIKTGAMHILLAAHYNIKTSTLLLTTKAHITIINMEYKLSTSNMAKRVPHVLVPHQMGLSDY